MPNISTDETAKFNQLASRWWDPAGEFKTLHQINPTRLQYIMNHCQLSGIKALDIGCGGGILTEALAKQGAQVIGVDAADRVLEVARLHAIESELEIEYHLSTAEEFAETQANSFDVITCMELLEHVPDPQLLLQACSTMLKPGGKLFVSTLNRNPKAYLLGILAAEYIMNLIPKGTHDYQKFIKPSELQQWLETLSMTVTDISGMNYNPIFNSCNLTTDVSINYLMCAQKAEEVNNAE